LGSKALALRMGKIRLPDAGASISLALEMALGMEQDAASPTPAHPLRWRLRNAGVEKGAEIDFPDVGASVSLALDERQRWEYRQNSLVRYRVYNDTIGITIYTS